MRICFFHKLSAPFTYHTPAEGATVSILELARRVSKENEVFVVNTNSGNMYDRTNRTRFIGTRIYDFSDKSGFFSRIKALGDFSKLYYASPWIIDTLAHTAIGLRKIPKEIDVLHSTSPFPIILKNFFGVKAKVNLFHLHELPSSYDGFLGSCTKIGNASLVTKTLFLKNNSAIIVPSTASAKRFIKMSAVTPEKVFVIPNGIDFTRFHWATNQVRSDNIILYVGAIVPPKGIHFLIDAVRIVQNHVPNVRLQIVGDPQLWYPSPNYQEYYEKLQKIARGVRNIEFLGAKNRDEIVKIYNRAAVVAVPTVFFESFSMVILEAMASKTPVIASIAGATPELIDHGKTGLLVPPCDSKALAEGLVALLTDRKLRMRITENAYHNVKERYSWNIVMKKILNLYQRYSR